jgi:hypothetical protein
VSSLFRSRSTEYSPQVLAQRLNLQPGCMETLSSQDFLTNHHTSLIPASEAFYDTTGARWSIFIAHNSFSGWLTEDRDGCARHNVH